MAQYEIRQIRAVGWPYPYIVYDVTGGAPMYVAVAMTKWGAHRAIEKNERGELREHVVEKVAT